MMRREAGFWFDDYNDKKADSRLDGFAQQRLRSQLPLERGNVTEAHSIHHE